MCIIINLGRGVCNMPNSAETIEKLARQLEQQKILSDLQDCHTLEDFQKLVEKYKAICQKHGQ